MAISKDVINELRAIAEMISEMEDHDEQAPLTTIEDQQVALQVAPAQEPFVASYNVAMKDVVENDKRAMEALTALVKDVREVAIEVTDALNASATTTTTTPEPVLDAELEKCTLSYMKAIASDIRRVAVEVSESISAGAAAIKQVEGEQQPLEVVGSDILTQMQLYEPPRPPRLSDFERQHWQPVRNSVAPTISAENRTEKERASDAGGVLAEMLEASDSEPDWTHTLIPSQADISAIKSIATDGSAAILSPRVESELKTWQSAITLTEAQVELVATLHAHSSDDQDSSHYLLPEPFSAVEPQAQQEFEVPQPLLMFEAEGASSLEYDLSHIWGATAKYEPVAAGSWWCFEGADDGASSLTDVIQASTDAISTEQQIRYTEIESEVAWLASTGYYAGDVVNQELASYRANENIYTHSVQPSKETPQAPSPQPQGALVLSRRKRDERIVSDLNSRFPSSSPVADEVIEMLLHEARRVQWTKNLIAGSAASTTHKSEHQPAQQGWQSTRIDTVAATGSLHGLYASETALESDAALDAVLAEALRLIEARNQRLKLEREREQRSKLSLVDRNELAFRPKL